MRTLTIEEARAFYDRFGVKQDQQGFYEAPALAVLVANSRLADARSVFEYGCGTGRFARELLEHHLPRSCRYVGVDISSTMVKLASERLASFQARAAVVLSTGDTGTGLPDGSVDRFMSTYVLDLLDESSARQVVAEAHRVLSPDGLLCLAGIAPGATRVSKITMSAWLRLFAWKPALVGGCRPTHLADLLQPGDWQVCADETVVAWGVASGILVATPRLHPGKA